MPLDTAIAAMQDQVNGSSPSPLNEASRFNPALEQTVEPFPSPRHTIKGDQPFYNDVKRWLGMAGHAYLNTHEHDANALALYLEQLTFDNGEQWIDHKGSRYRIGFYDVGGLARTAAEWSLETYIPPYRRRFTATDASKGGRSSKRRSKLLERYRALPLTMSISEAAVKLDCHPRTVSRLRAMIVAEQERADQAILDHLDAEAAASKGTHLAPTHEPEEELIGWREELDAMWASMGLIRMSDGSLYFPDPEPVSLDEVVL